MCVGLAAKVVGIKNGMAVIDASGAKREVSAELLRIWNPEITLWYMQALPLQKSRMTTKRKPMN